jgi:hypothetical protein
VKSTIVAPLAQPFSQTIYRMRPKQDIVFGTTATIGAKDISTAIRNNTQLNAQFRPLQGEFSAGGSALGGAGVTTINSEIQRYATVFGASGGQPDCHIMDTDGLRLQAVLSAGTFNSYLRGQINTGGSGLNVNAPGATTATGVADIGITVGDLSNIEVGDVATNGNTGLMVVTAKNPGGSTITF